MTTEKAMNTLNHNLLTLAPGVRVETTETDTTPIVPGVLAEGDTSATADVVEAAEITDLAAAAANLLDNTDLPDQGTADRLWVGDVVSGLITTRVEVLPLEVPVFSMQVGYCRDDGSIRPFVQLKARNRQELERIKGVMNDYAMSAAAAAEQVLFAIETDLAKREARAIRVAAEAKAEEEAAVKAEEAAKAKKATKQAAYLANKEKRRTANREAASAKPASGKKAGKKG